MSLNFTKYALLGSGKLAKHLKRYLGLLGLPTVFWSRSNDSNFNSLSIMDPHQRLIQTVQNVSHILVAVSDRSLAQFAQVGGPDKIRVHFSGTAAIEGMSSVHPLMTFGQNLENMDWYKSIPFITESGLALADLLPGFPNQQYCMDAKLRPLYHALCTLAGNSTFLLWQQVIAEFEHSLKLPRQILLPYLHQTVNNLQDQKNMTGPLSRGDWNTLKEHLQVLAQNKMLKDSYLNHLRLANESGLDIPKELL